MWGMVGIGTQQQLASYNASGTYLALESPTVRESDGGIVWDGWEGVLGIR